MFSINSNLTIFLDSFTERRHGEVEYFIVVGAADDEMRLHLDGRCKEYMRTIRFNEIADMERDVIFPTKNFSDCLELKNLENLEICRCKKFMVIFGEAEDERHATSNDGTSQITLALNIWRIKISGCEEFKYLIGPGAETRYYFPALREIKITNCQQFQGITADPLVLPRLAHAAFPCLESIEIYCCHELEEIIATSSSEMPHSTSTLARIPTHFSHLTSLDIRWCRKMKRLLNHDILPCLSNLQRITVRVCPKMDELTSTGDLCTAICLPNLKKLEFISLLELRSIGAMVLACPIETIEVRRCPKIKRIPLQMEELSNGATTPPSSLKKIVINEDEIGWWESLEWESLEAKNALRPYLHEVKW